MAGEAIYALSGDPTHGGAAVGECTHARILPSCASKYDAKNETDVVTDHDIQVELYGADYAELQALINDAAADLVLPVIGLAGAAENHTLLDVKFVEEIAPAEIPPSDEGGKLASYGIRGFCENPRTGTPPVRKTLAELWTVA